MNQPYALQTRQTYYFRVADGVTFRAGDLVARQLGQVPGDDRVRLPEEPMADDTWIILGVAFPEESRVTGNADGTVLVRTDISGPILVDARVVDIPPDGKESLRVLRHVWVATASEFQQEDPSGSGEEVGPVGILLRHRGSHPQGGTRWELLLYSAPEYRICRETKRNNFFDV